MTAEALAGAETRGERNNNPGNIDYDPRVPWQGQLGIEILPEGSAASPRFARFDTAANGIRAIGRILRSYIERDGATTLRGIIARWAPPSDANDTSAYIMAVAHETGLKIDQTIAPDEGDLTELVRAIIVQENGRCIYGDNLIAGAVSEALV